jgi:hypothetical protein
MRMQQPSSSVEKCCICSKEMPSSAIEEHTIHCFEKQAIKIQNSPVVNKKRQSVEKTYGIFNCPKKQKIESTSGKKTQEATASHSKAEISNEIVIETIEKKPSKKAPAAPKSSQPLADVMRPCDFDSYFGQERAVGEKSIIRNLLKNDTVTSSIFFGPPGQLSVSKNCRVTHISLPQQDVERQR